MNSHKHRNIRNPPGARKKIFSSSGIQNSKAIITHHCYYSYRASFIRLRFAEKKQLEAKQAEDFSMKQILTYFFLILHNVLGFFLLLSTL